MKSDIITRRLLGALVVGAIGIAVAGCSGTSEGNASGGDDGSLQTVVMTQAPLTAYAPVWVADEKGFFAEEGIQIEFTDAVASGTEQIAMITSGKADMVTSTPSEVIKAEAAGLHTQLIVAVQQNADADEADNSAILVPKGSDITRPRDLDGTTIAVVGVNSQEDMKVKATIDADGGDSSTVTFVQSPPDAMAGLLQTEEIQAMAQNQPVASQLLASGDYTRISGAVSAGLGGTPGITILSTPEWTADDEEAAAGVRAAIEAAVEWANDPANQDELDALMAEHLGVDVSVIEAMTPEVFGTEVTLEGLEKVQSGLIRYGLLDTEVDLSALIWNG